MWALCAMFVLAFPGSFQFGRWYGSYVHKGVRRVEQRVTARAPDSVVLDTMCPSIYPHREAAAIYIKMLKEARFGPFAALRDERFATLPEGARPLIR